MKMARFQGDNKLGDFIDNQQISGNLFFLLNAADDFLKRHLPISSTFKPGQLQRIDKSALPALAVREALINALCHRDYADQATDFSLAIYEGRLEIWNSGTLLKKLTIAALKHAHESVLRNELIASVFYKRGYIEKWGIGTNKMIDLCKQENLPEPDFKERTGGLAVIFHFKYPISERISKGQSKPADDIVLNERQHAILQIIASYNTVGIQQILQELDSPPSKRTVQKDLRYLKLNDMIEPKGLGSVTTWRLKKPPRDV